MIAAARAVLVRDLRLALRHRSAMARPLVFFVLVAALFPLAIGPERSVLAPLAPGIIWVAALLAALLGAEDLFSEDFADGTLEQLVLSPCPASLLVLARVSAHWLTTGLPLVLVSPLIALFLQLPLAALPVLLVTLLLGTPFLSLIAAMGAALTVGLRTGGLLLGLLVLPLYAPVLIFAAGAVERATAGLTVAGPLYFLAGMLALAITLVPLATAAAIRVSLE